MQDFLIVVSISACSILGILATERDLAKNPYDFKTGLALGVSMGFLSAFLYFVLIDYIF